MGLIDKYKLLQEMCDNCSIAPACKLKEEKKCSLHKIIDEQPVICDKNAYDLISRSQLFNELAKIDFDGRDKVYQIINSEYSIGEFVNGKDDTEKNPT